METGLRRGIGETEAINAGSGFGGGISGKAWIAA